MTKTMHSPGPWHRNIPPARKYPTVWAGRNTHVAAVVAGAPHRSGNGETMSDEELEANINLIAAAPELLAALQEAESVIEALDRSGYSQGDVLATIRAAISKAEGRANG